MIKTESKSRVEQEIKLNLKQQNELKLGPIDVTRDQT